MHRFIVGASVEEHVHAFNRARLETCTDEAGSVGLTLGEVRQLLNNDEEHRTAAVDEAGGGDAAAVSEA